MRSVSRAYQVFRVQKILRRVPYVVNADGVHVVYKYRFTDNGKVGAAKVTAPISRDDLSAHLTPLRRYVKLLIKNAVEAKTDLSDSPS